jgi:hypothetical protein
MLVHRQYWKAGFDHTRKERDPKKYEQVQFGNEETKEHVILFRKLTAAGFHWPVVPLKVQLSLLVTW